MATLTAITEFDMFTFLTEGSLVGFFESASVIGATSTQFVIRDVYDGTTEQLTLDGTFGGYTDGYPTTGTVTGGRYSITGGPTFSFSSASISVPDFTDFVLEDDLIGLFVELLRGADTIIGSSGGDILYGIDGNDTLDGRGGEDLLVGGFGNDRYYVNTSLDEILEDVGEGIDTVFSTAAAYYLPTDDLGYVENLTYLGTANFTGIGNALNNVIRGAGGSDRLDGGLGADSLNGGNGNDHYWVDNAYDRAIEASATGGVDTVNSLVSYTLGANVERLNLGGTAHLRASGNTLANIIEGNAGNNIIDGKAGADAMRGLAGNDTYYVDNAGDVVTELANLGNDLVVSTISYTLTTNVERLTLGGAAAVNGTGNALANVLIGNGAANILNGVAGLDTLSGGAGNDTLNGGLGNDRLTGGTGLDKFVFDTALSSTANLDRIMDFSVADDSVVLDKSIFTALGALGTLSTGGFHAGTAAHDADDRIIYDAASGRLYYDADGNGAGAKILFATVTAGLALTHSDFLIVA